MAKSDPCSDSKTACLFGAISFFSSILHNIFLIYHIELFVSVYKIDKLSFWIGEALFLLWNSLNDPLVGWISDRANGHTTSSKPAKQCHAYHANDETSTHKRITATHRESAAELSHLGASPDIVRRRILSVKYCGPLLALSFSLIWVNWLPVALQFCISLCAYDGFLTIVDLHQSALLAELSVTPHDRYYMTGFQSIFAALGSTSVFASYLFWDRNDINPFRWFCIGLAAIAAVGFWITCGALSRNYNNKSKRLSPSVHDFLPREIPNCTSTKLTIRQFLSQLSGHRNFILFSAMNLVQVFHCHFNSNFFPLFLEVLINDHRHLGSFLIGISFILPHVNNIVFLVLCESHGVYAVVRGLLLLKFALAASMLYLGVSYTWMLCIYIASNRVFTEGVCKLFALAVTELVDEDYVTNHREEPMSALMYGTSNFLAKPGQTLAPLLGTALISYLVGYDIFERPVLPSDTSMQLKTNLREAEHEDYKNACFHALVLIPMLCASVQLILWSFYQLRGQRLLDIKRQRLQNNVENYFFNV